MKQGLSNYLFHSKRLFQVYIIGILLFVFARIVFLLRIDKENTILNNTNDLFHGFVVGAKFDTMVILYGMLIPMVLALASLFIQHIKFSNIISQVSRFFLGFVFIFFFVILTIDIFYYSYFQSHLSVLFFGFFEDDTKAVMKSVWSDYPLVTVTAILLFFVALIHFLFKRIFRKVEVIDSLPSLRGALLLSLVVLFLFFSGLRGSYGTFPLQIDDAVISENAIINLLPMNGVFALKEALMTRKKQMNIDGNIKWLKQIGYDNQQKAVSDYFGSQAVLNSGDDIQSAYFARSPKNDFLKNNPPHVVIFQMESMSNYNLYFHNKELNLFGSLEPFWNSEIVYRKCLPYGNGTINTLEGLLVNTPVTSLAQSANRYVSFSSAVALPFKNAGYQTTYVTGGKLGWRNINEFIPHQYFDKVAGNANILESIPGTLACEWGVYDEYLFDYVFNQLNNAADKPQLIFAMTTTNHTPFEVPAHYKPYPVSIPENVKGKLLTDVPTANRNFTNLQYTNDCLGIFLKKIQSSPLADRTIVVATGDHNNLMLFDFTENQIMEKRGVPLFFSIPPAYLKNHKVDTSYFTSQRDIFPTLVNLALSDARYFNGGQFLFDSTLTSHDFFSINLMSKEAVNNTGAVIFDEQPSWYLWNEGKNVLVKSNQSSPVLDSLLQKSRSYFSALSYFIKKEIDLNKNSSPK